MLRNRSALTILTLALLLSSCGGRSDSGKAEELPDWSNWEAVEEQARGQVVHMMMWQGDPLINNYMQHWVVPRLAEQYGVQLELLSGQGSQIVSTLMAEKEAGRRESELDVVWINGETFYQLRQIRALYGPFAESLPNSRFVNWDNPFISRDFQQPVDGYECPWGNVQLALIYDSTKVPVPPQTLAEWEEWFVANPGKFTIGNDFTGMTLLKSWLIHLAGGRESLNGPFDEDKYQQYSAELWQFINRNKKYFWNRGESFPSSVAQMHQLFANGELWFSMSNNDAEVDNKVSQGFFPASSRAYVPLTGTIQNSHYLGIPQYATDKAGALVTINFLLSPEAQWQKLQPAVWGDGTVLSMDRLRADSLQVEWVQRFEQVPGRRYAPRREEIASRALPEPAPEYMIRLFADFRQYVIGN